MPTLTATYIYSGMADYWGGDGDRWDDNKGCLFAYYGKDTTLHDLIDQLVDDFNSGGDCETMPEDITDGDVRGALLEMLNDRGRADYAAGALAECAVEYAEANGLDGSFVVGDEVMIDNVNDEEANGVITKVTDTSVFIDIDDRLFRRDHADVYPVNDAEDCDESPIFVVLMECEVCSECKTWCDHYADDVCKTCYEKEDIAA